MRAAEHCNDGGTPHSQEYQLVGANGALVLDDDSLQKYLAAAADAGAAPALFYQSAAVSHPAVTAAEVVSFVPHPKTMTMAGEWEYFAAGSQHPFPYAIAELIDNSLRATRSNTTTRRIVVTLVSAAVAPAGLVSVWDNGCGMSMRQLSEWAVMNLTMEDRGQKPREQDRPRQTQGAASAKQLCSDLSYFGVGSKNAAFFMGRCIKLASKSRDNVLVHELQISADALEQRYQTSPDQVCTTVLPASEQLLQKAGGISLNAEARMNGCGWPSFERSRLVLKALHAQVYKEQIQKRLPGELPTAPSPTFDFAVLADWAAAEVGTGSNDADGGADSTFTRVVVSDLKADILQQFKDDAAQNVCRQLAHLYHYYLHGPDGNTRTGALALAATMVASTDLPSRLPCSRLLIDDCGHSNRLI